MGITPQTASKHGIDYATMLKGRTEVPPQMTEQLVAGSAASSRIAAWRSSISRIPGKRPVAPSPRP
jgi:hypothetical protein